MSFRKTLLFVVFGIVFIAALVCAKSDLPNVVAVVNGEEITKEQLEDAVIKRESVSVLNELIMQTMIDQEAEKAGIVITNEQLVEKVKELKAQFCPQGDLGDFLFERGSTKSQLYSSVKTQMQIEALVRKDIKVVDSDYESYYKISQIFVIVPSSSDDETKSKNDLNARKKIDAAAADIKNGVTFADAASKYSEDHQSNRKGGDMGWISVDRFPEEMAAAIKNLKVGEVSEPIRASNSYHLVMLTGIGGETSGKDREDLKEIIIRSRMNVQGWLAGVQQNAVVFNALMPQGVAEKIEQQKKEAELMKNAPMPNKPEPPNVPAAP